MVCGAVWLHALGDHAKIQIRDPVDPASMMIPRYSSANIKWIKVQMVHMHQARNFSIVKGRCQRSHYHMAGGAEVVICLEDRRPIVETAKLQYNLMYLV